MFSVLGCVLSVVGIAVSIALTYPHMPISCSLIRVGTS